MRYIFSTMGFARAIMGVALGLSLMSTTVMAGSIDVSEAYVREVIPGQVNSAAFMSLANSGDADKVLVSINSNAAERVELHQHIHQQNNMRMEQVERVVIPAGEQFEFSPGGYHVMFIGVTSSLRAGENVEMSLQFSDGSAQQIDLPVVSIKHR
ncbi:hypothetical protein SIN8267_01559 [Sinobacterium norvegicum]|uniref:Copper chaperone PCu(A)C n=1 Tax=Sinobacterium norvegicum TaxID=1641715 RepID=A0ABM9AET0_9GAMM|nr:copper chaperone PCu(A)C [Sinobacterium norvegicum]CAH0991453.1 hypothetical protein SIN8267_01559 [Sinobacterium norvegicum]